MLVRQQQVEVWVLDIVEAVVGGSRVEDDRVEAKRKWPTDHRKAARQIAGLANAAGGEAALWIVGLDEDGHLVADPGDVEPADWWAQVSKYFSEVAPDLNLLRVPTPHGTVAALWLETGRSPYVVTTNGHGGVDREVPWRRGTNLRSAHRSEILRAVVGEAEVPQLDAISGWVRALRRPAQGKGKFGEEAHPVGVEFEYWLDAYAEVAHPARLPEYRWAAHVTVGGQDIDLTRPSIRGPQMATGSNSFGIPTSQSVGSIVYVQNSGLHVNGSDSLALSGRHFVPDEGGELAGICARLSEQSSASDCHWLCPRGAQRWMHG